MKIPTGTQSHKSFRLKGKGLPKLGQYGRGDQIVRVMVEIPTKLNAEQVDALKKFDELDKKDRKAHPLYKSFFDRVKDLF